MDRRNNSGGRRSSNPSDSLNMEFGTVFVTVGTTKFDNLISSITHKKNLQVLQSRGCKELILQIGDGSFIPDEKNTNGIKIIWFRFKDNILDYIRNSDLVVSHAGAGTCLETLSAGKKLLVVVNEELMDNHQKELASKLGELGYLFYTNCNNLGAYLTSMDLSKLKPYSPGVPEQFARFIDYTMGFHSKEL